MANRVAQEAFNHLVGDLRTTHGDNLASVVLYGSAAAGSVWPPTRRVGTATACATPPAWVTTSRRWRAHPVSNASMGMP